MKFGMEITAHTVGGSFNFLQFPISMSQLL